MYQIINKVLKGNLKYKDTVILDYEINYPYISTNYPIYGIEIFNKRNEEQALKLENYAKGNLFEDAKELYDFNSSNNYPVMVYEVLKNYEITELNNWFISLYSDEYIFSGGAHGNTTRSSQNFNLIAGKDVPLRYFYPNDDNYVSKILLSINRQIEEQIQSGTNPFFENYCELVLETFNVNNFFIKNGKVFIFFQQYDISAYYGGIQVFEVSL